MRLESKTESSGISGMDSGEQTGEKPAVDIDGRFWGISNSWIRCPRQLTGPASRYLQFEGRVPCAVMRAETQSVSSSFSRPQPTGRSFHAIWHHMMGPGIDPRQKRAFLPAVPFHRGRTMSSCSAKTSRTLLRTYGTEPIVFSRWLVVSACPVVLIFLHHSQLAPCRD